jgi:hypothetical protein
MKNEYVHYYIILKVKFNCSENIFVQIHEIFIDEKFIA